MPAGQAPSTGILAPNALPSKIQPGSALCTAPHSSESTVKKCELKPVTCPAAGSTPKHMSKWSGSTEITPCDASTESEAMACATSSMSSRAASGHDHAYGARNAEQRRDHQRGAERLGPSQEHHAEEERDEDLDRGDQRHAGHRAMVEREEIEDLPRGAQDAGRDQPRIGPREGGAHRARVVAVEEGRDGEEDDADQATDPGPEERIV